MAGMDVKDSLERLAAEGTRGAAAPPAAAVRRRRRNRRLRLAAGAAVLAVALGAATPVAWDALGSFRAQPVAPVGEDAGPPAPARPAPDAGKGTADPDTPVSNDGAGPSAGPGAGQGGTGAGAPGSPGAEPAGQPGADPGAVAAYFLRSEFGMREPIAAVRSTGATSARVDVHPRAAGEGGRETGGPITTVTLRREGGGWVVTGASTAEIKVRAPAPGARVRSPIALAGSALAFEGNVQVRVLANRTGKDPVLGEDHVTGGGDVMRPFTGRITYRGATGAGWVAFFTTSEADGQFLNLSLVPVRLG
jgi:Immunoglobulin-like domain of bacterial spore germination